MKSLSIEQFNKAQKYEHQFQTAVYSRYLRAQPTSYYAELSELCSELNIHLKLSCPACVLNAVTQLGKIYFETKQGLEAENQKNQKPEQSDSSDSSDTKKPVIAKKPVVTRSQKPKKYNKK